MRRKSVFAWVRMVHAWSGAVLSLLLAVLGLSGTLLVFRADYLRASIPEARQVAPLDAESLGRISETAEAMFGVDAVRSIRFADPDLGITQVRLLSGDYAYLDRNGELVTQWSGHNRLDEWIFDLHHHLLAGEAGELVIGIAALAGIGLVLSGLFAIWPARRAIGARVLPKSAARRDLLASHRNLGLIIAAPLMLFLVTGAGMVFSKEAKAVMSVFDGPRETEPVLAPAQAGDVDWMAALPEAQNLFPDARFRMVIWPRGKQSHARVRLKQASEWLPNGRTYVSVDPASSSLTGIEDALSAPRSEQLYNSFYPLHSGQLGQGIAGRFYDGFVALTGLGLFLLGAVGCYAFLTKPLRFRMRRRYGLAPHSPPS